MRIIKDIVAKIRRSSYFEYTMTAMVGIIPIMIIFVVVVLIANLGKNNNRYQIKTFNHIYFVDEYKKMPDGTIEIEHEGSKVIMHGYTIKENKNFKKGVD